MVSLRYGQACGLARGAESRTENHSSTGKPVVFWCVDKRTLKSLSKEWQSINRRNLYRAIGRLYESKLVNYSERKDGTISVVLNREGHKAALRYKPDNMAIKKPSQWDSKWRIVIFDVPESMKNLRDTLRRRLKQLGLMELQKSVFVHPYECRNEIDFVIELYQARRYVRFIEATSIDNELHLKHKFHLL